MTRLLQRLAARANETAAILRPDPRLPLPQETRNDARSAQGAPPPLFSNTFTSPVVDRAAESAQVTVSAPFGSGAHDAIQRYAGGLESNSVWLREGMPSAHAAAPSHTRMGDVPQRLEKPSAAATHPQTIAERGSEVPIPGASEEAEARVLAAHTTTPPAAALLPEKRQDIRVDKTSAQAARPASRISSERTAAAADSLPAMLLPAAPVPPRDVAFAAGAGREDTTELHIHIGRIDVTAVREAEPTRRKPAAAPAATSLDAYLAQRRRS